MKDQIPVNNLNQNIEQLEPKPQSPIQINVPEKILKEENSIPKKKKNSKNKKIFESNISDDDIEHPDALNSDCCEESFEEIKNNFYENKKNEKLLIIEKNKILRANSAQILEQKLKAEQDSKQLKENIGKVVLNCKFLNDKSLGKNDSQKYNLIIKPEQVINNFILERSTDINEQHNLNKCGIINNNNTMSNNIKKNNSLKCIQIHKNKKNIKLNHRNQSQHIMGKIIKIPLNLKGKKPQIIKQINNIPQSTKNILTKNEQKVVANDVISQKINTYCNQKIPLKKIIKIAPINNITSLETGKNQSPQITLKKINYNHINKIQKEDIVKTSYNNMNDNSIYNKCSNSNNKNKKDLPFDNSKNNNKLFCPNCIEHNIRKSNEITINSDKKASIQKIPLSFKVINNPQNKQLYNNPKEKNNFSNCHTEANSSINKDLRINSIVKINNSYIESEKENYPSNSCNKKTIQRGGKFNNISTTYVIISKNSSPKLKNPQPSLTIDYQNIPKNEKLSSNLSTRAIHHSPLNSPFQLASIYPQNISFNQNQVKTVSNNKSRDYLLKRNKNKSINYQTENNKNINFVNYPFFGRKNLNSDDTKTIYYMKNKSLNKPVIYRYNYGDNFWPDESFFSYYNTSGYNY